MFRLPAGQQLVRSTAGAAAVLLVSCVMVFAQDFQPATSSNARQFVGTWQASFNGSPFLTVIFAMPDNKVTGSFGHANIDVNQAGELTKAEAKDGADPITDAQVKGNVLRFTTKSTDGSEDSLQAELRLIDPNKGEIRMIGIPPDVPSPKPWQVTRVSPKQEGANVR
jgi:hypothetical protein